MNKKIIQLFTVSVLATTITTCGTGSTSGRKLSRLKLTPVVAPPGSAPVQNLAAGMGSGSVYAESSSGNPLYLLGNSKGTVYAPLTADTGMTGGPNIIGAWLISDHQLFGAAPAPDTVATYFVANLTTPLSTISLNTASWESATLTNTNRTICFGAPESGDNGCAGSNAPTGARFINSTSGNTRFMFVGYGQPNILDTESIGYNILSNNAGVGTPVSDESYISLKSCVDAGSGVYGESATTVSAIAASGFLSNPLVIAGTNSGDVCVGIVPITSESTAFIDATLVNVTALAIGAGRSYTFKAAPVTVNGLQATGGYNTLGAVNAIAATPQGSYNTNTLIAWTQGTSGLYSVRLTGSIKGSYTFANLVDTDTYVNSPYDQPVSVIYVDFNNTIYVGTFTNMVYVLRNGSKTWLSATIPNATAQTKIHNFSAGYNGNVYVYTITNGTTPHVFSLDFLQQ